MFRILIVEDIKRTLDQLTKYISAAFKEPNGESSVALHTAEGVEDARRVIQAAADNNQPYHAVILDFKLPEQAGGNPELARIDQSLCLLIRQTMRSTLVAHITAYIEDEVVREHLRLVHDEKVTPALTFLKADPEYAIKLVDELRSFLYGTRIEEQIALIFGEPRPLAFAARVRGRQPERGRQRTRAERSLTHDIAALRRDIAAHWHHLDQKRREWVRQFFRVDDETKPVRVSLRQPAAE